MGIQTKASSSGLSSAKIFWTQVTKDGQGIFKEIFKEYTLSISANIQVASKAWYFDLKLQENEHKLFTIADKCYIGSRYLRPSKRHKHRYFRIVEKPLS